MNSPTPPSEFYSCPRTFGEWVIRSLAGAGHQALFAGGCVRDQLMGRAPKDYDVATSALPEQVRDVFGRRRTISIGAAFGVITVIGNPEVGNVEVATFRCDGDYSDGRRPDHVTFTDARNDALRRDFTINGLFFDPISDEVLDFVDGQDDIKNRMIRAIGNPTDRFNEDKLRMLRAIRFATTLGFQIDQATRSAIIEHADGIQKVSGERVAAEMLRVLQSPDRGSGLQLLLDCHLSPTVLPEFHRLPAELQERLINFLQDHRNLAHSIESTLSLILYLHLQPSCEPSAEERPSIAIGELKPEWITHPLKSLVARWKLSNDLRDSILACLKDFPRIIQANHLPWSQVQPILIGRWASLSVAFAEILCDWLGLANSGVTFCQAKIRLETQVLNPAPIVTGNQLQALGIPKGPELGVWMRKLRAMQLDQQLVESSEALDFVRKSLESGKNSF